MKPLGTYACYADSDEIRKNSSSGGIFSILADTVFQRNGIVYGVTMADDCYSAVYATAQNEIELQKLRGSKYLQACLGNTFSNVKEDLEAGRIVLFTGTGCQINGLKQFLKKDYDNLICVDVICHGTISPALWKKYVCYQEKKHKAKLIGVNFRSKNPDWANFGMDEMYQGANKVYIPKDKDAYMQMFLRNYCLRPSCYKCAAKSNPKSDITIGDFWGIDNVLPEIDDHKGVSAVFIRTEKGRAVFSDIKSKVIAKEVEYQDAVKENVSEYSSVSKPSQRDTFYTDMNRMGFNRLQAKYIPDIYSTKSKIKRLIKKTLKIEGGVTHIK